ncbi:MAG TPA: lipopolysaccharide heptosyltransferase II, partial [bacterium]|nr:lipopolysaccharide heptosyltransferase II [bacterium]
MKSASTAQTPRRQENLSLENIRIKNILIRVPNWLGDTMMSTPTVSAVRKMFPKAKLSILSKPVFTTFWKEFPGVEDVIGLEKGLGGFWRTVSAVKQKQFDAALIMPTSLSSAFLMFAAGVPTRIGWGGEGREIFLTHVVSRPEPRQKHLVWEYLELAQKGLEKGLPGGSVQLHSPIPQEAVRGLRQVWSDTGVPTQKAFIALAPGATYGPAKRWPLPYWQDLIQRLLEERKESLLIMGGWEEEAYLRPLLEGVEPQKSNRLHLLAGRTTATILAAMLSKCKLLVTNDSGPMHVAAAVGIPTVALFGSSSPSWTRPFG